MRLLTPSEASKLTLAIRFRRMLNKRPEAVESLTSEMVQPVKRIALALISGDNSRLRKDELALANRYREAQEATDNYFRKNRRREISEMHRTALRLNLKCKECGSALIDSLK